MEDTKVLDKPEVTEVVTEVTEEVVQDTEEPIEINGRVFTLLGTKNKGRGKKKVDTLYLLKPTAVNGSYDEFIASVKAAVGAENFNKCILALIRENCKDATLQAISTAEDGIVTDAGWVKGFQEGFTDASRRSGPHVKDITERLKEIFIEVNPLMTRSFGGPNVEPLAPAEHAKMVQLSIEFSDLNSQLEKIKGKRKGKATKAKAA